MTDFTQQYSGFRYAATHRSDTIQLVAYRELGSAAEWARLVWFNNLVAPFITDDPALANDRVLLSGAQIKIPTTVAESLAPDEAVDILKTDCLLTKGRLTIDPATGDFAMVAGRENLKQALSNRIITDPGELLFHPEYGCKLQRRRGSKNTPVALLLGRMDVQDALEQETRLKRINAITPTGNGDVLAVTVDVTPITGSDVTAKASV